MEGRRGSKRKKKSHSGTLPRGKKGSVNAIIIFKNITGVATATAKNRLQGAKPLDDFRADRKSKEKERKKERRERLANKSTPSVNVAYGCVITSKGKSVPLFI